TFNEIDMSAAMAARERWREPFEKKHGVRLGFMSIFVKAAIVALKEIPAVNAEIDGDEIVYKNHYDIGVAVRTEQGLVVPVGRAAAAMRYTTSTNAARAPGPKPDDGNLPEKAVARPPFPLTRRRSCRSLSYAPNPTPPQSAILGMHKIERRPIAIGDPAGER